MTTPDQLAQEFSKDELEALKIAHEIDNLKYEQRKNAADAEAKELGLEQSKRQIARSEARPAENYVYTLGEVREVTVQHCIESLTTWSNESPGTDLTLVLTSPGGSVLDGLALYDSIRALAARGHTIRTIASGMAASMGAVLLQAGDERIIQPNAFLLIHEVSSGAMGKASALRDRVDFTERLQDRLLTILADRSTLSIEEIRERWERRDWWLGAEEALDLGFVDNIGEVAA